MKPFLIIAYFLTGLAFTLAFVSVFVGGPNEKQVERVYGVKVVSPESHFSGANKLIIERDGQRLKCDIPSSENLKNKDQLICETPAPVTKISPTG